MLYYLSVVSFVLNIGAYSYFGLHAVKCFSTQSPRIFTIADVHDYAISTH